MSHKPIADVVLEFFKETNQSTATVNDILKYYVEHCEKDNPIELKKARHAIYLKANRLAKAGELIAETGKGRTVEYRLPASKPPSQAAQAAYQINERTLLMKREAELRYELDTCIAEAKGYEEMKDLIPSKTDLLIKAKDEAKSRAIQLTGLLTSTQKILREITR